MIISTFRSVKQAYVSGVADVPWTMLAELFTEHSPVTTKAAGALFNLVEFKTLGAGAELGRRYHGEEIKGVWTRDPSGTYDEIPNTVRRCKNNVVALNGIVLDVDDDMTIEQAQEHYKDIEHVLYTTFRHRPDKHKFRIVIPFSRPLLAEDIAGRQAAITERFPGVDSASFTVSQSFYFHSGLVEPYANWNRGHMIDPYEFEERAPVVWHPKPTSAGLVSDDFKQAYKVAVLDSLGTCSGLHYAGKVTNLGVLCLVNICRSIDCTFEEFDSICAKIADSESQLVNPAIRLQAWTGWDGNRITREKRDQFILAYGGKPVRVDTALKNQYHERLELIQAIDKIMKDKQL
jgi:hypothetical protein